MAIVLLILAAVLLLIFILKYPAMSLAFFLTAGFVKAIFLPDHRLYPTLHNSGIGCNHFQDPVAWQQDKRNF